MAMFDHVDQRYFEMRARSSRARAAEANDPGVRRIYEKLAEEYEGKAAAIHEHLNGARSGARRVVLDDRE